MINNDFCKSTLTAFNNTTTSYSANAPIVFTTTDRKTGRSVLFTNGGTAVNIASKGLYLVNFSVTGTVQGATAGDVTVELYRNGVAIPSTLTTSTSTGTTDFVNVANSTVIEVDSACPCNGVFLIPLTLVALTDVVISNASITVTKIA